MHKIPVFSTCATPLGHHSVFAIQFNMPTSKGNIAYNNSCSTGTRELWIFLLIYISMPTIVEKSNILSLISQ